ncbi:leucine efflux protein LeuE [Alysiella crassa]|uniref:Leucine efflux protein n=1 Tax=Alysiella crassa TaxID=153491 RepID=A0A376BUP7_9NEIS|nr:leucine efflux protein LeuE [Alysiella crassa]SSY80707.1 Leucine efflux protein [Alysiella crassa]
MFGITDLTAYVIGAIAIVLLPGPNSMYCLTVASQHGVRVAYQVVVAILLGDLILILATVLGAGTALQLYPTLFHAIRLLGGAYLAYLGWNLIRAGVKKWHSITPNSQNHDENAVSGSLKTPPQGIFTRALMLSLSNPKAILFFLSFFVPFVDPNYPNPALSFLILALIIQIISFTYLNILVFSGYKLTQTFRARVKTSAVAMGAVGLMFIGFAVKMWLNK